MKPCESNELAFHDKLLQVTEERAKELNNIHSKVSAKALTLTRKSPEFIAKSSGTKCRNTRQAENKLLAQFHLDAPKHSLDSNYFDKRAEVLVKRVLQSLKASGIQFCTWT